MVTANRLLFLLSLLMAPVWAIKADNPDALQHWYNNKYSMFIHFGVYSELGGVWNGKPVEIGYSEQIQAHGGIMADYYQEFATTFNPVKWDADAIARLAQEAGMRSIVITTKHHDGFCMYHSAYTPFNIVDATPFGRDILKELADACARHDLNLGLYYSLIDWCLHPWTSHNANPISPAHHDYNKKQVTELLTNYGPISELWFDMGSLTNQQSREIYDLVKELQPNCMVSGRLGNNHYDFCVMGDNQYPDYKIDAPWQTPASIFHETWGYRSWQVRDDLPGKTLEKLRSLLKVVSRGGNYLLNIGPRGDGSVVGYEADVLKGIGEWLGKYGEAIYETTANPFPEFYNWGEITARGNRVYLILSGDPTPAIELPVLSGKIKDAFFLGDTGRSLKVRNRRQSVTINIPPEMYRHDEVKVVVVDFTEDFAPQPQQIIDTRLGFLGFENAVMHYSYSCIDYYNNHRSVVRQSWNFTSPGRQTIPEVYFTRGEAGKNLEFWWNGTKELVTLDSNDKFQINSTGGKVEWQNRYVAGPFRSSFDRLHGHIGSYIDPLKEWGRGIKWQLNPEWEDNTEEYFGTRPREAIYVLNEISSEFEQDYIVELFSGDAVQVWLNGLELVMHNNPPNSSLNPISVLMQLQPGKNQLLVKFYNRYGNQSSYKINTRPEQALFMQKLQPRQFQRRELNTLEMNLHKPETLHEPMRMNNIRIEL